MMAGYAGAKCLGPNPSLQLDVVTPMIVAVRYATAKSAILMADSMTRECPGSCGGLA